MQQPLSSLVFTLRVPWMRPLKHICALALCWEIISQLGPHSECDPFNCQMQRAQQTQEEAEWPPLQSHSNVPEAEAAVYQQLEPWSHPCGWASAQNTASKVLVHTLTIPQPHGAWDVLPALSGYTLLPTPSISMQPVYSLKHPFSIQGAILHKRCAEVRPCSHWTVISQNCELVLKSYYLTAQCINSPLVISLMNAQRCWSFVTPLQRSPRPLCPSLTTQLVFLKSLMVFHFLRTS